MKRAWHFCFAGAGIGFLAGFVIVAVLSGGSSRSDGATIGVLLGTFLAGTGAIAGAIIGAVAELKRHREDGQEMHSQDET